MADHPKNKKTSETRQKNADPMSVKMIAGLGNPGEHFKNTYHNVGRDAVEKWAGPQAHWEKARGFFEYYRKEDRILIKPSGWMNESGQALKAAMKRAGVRPEELLVIHDDADIALGKQKMSFGRNAAGHKGVESVIRAIGSNQFWRLRIGVRNEKNKNPAADFVLKKISPADRRKFGGIFEKIHAEIFERKPRNLTKGP